MKLEVLIAPAITAFLLNAQPPCAEATTYYISSSQGSDTNVGTSSSAPWQNLVKIYVKGMAGTFTAGDSILLKAGDVFDGPLRVISAGTASSPILFDRYGAGANPIIYGDHPSVAWSSVVGHSGIYSVNLSQGGGTIQAVFDMNGNAYANTSQGADSLDVWLGKFQTNNWGYSYPLTYIRTPDSNPPARMHLFDWANVYASANYVTFQNLDIRNSNLGIVSTAKGTIARNNSIQDSLSMGIHYEANASYGEISSNSVTRAGDTLVYLLFGGNHWVHHNTLSYSGGNSNGVNILGCHVPAWEQCGIGMQQTTNNTVEYNSISNVYGSFFDFWLVADSTVRCNYGFHSGGAAYPDGTGLKVNNNVFNVDGGGSGIGGAHDYDSAKSPAPDSGANLIYNNVVYGFKNYGLYSGAGKTGVIFRNNILIVTSSTPSLVDIGSGANSDYNLYFSTSGTTKGWTWNGATYSTLAAFQAASGQEAHALYTDPQFFSASPVTAADFKIKATSACVDKGQDLKIAGLLPPTAQYQDFIGMPIPQRAGPDIGPYEAGGLAPATDLRVLQQ